MGFPKNAQLLHERDNDPTWPPMLGGKPNPKHARINSKCYPSQCLEDDVHLQLQSLCWMRIFKYHMKDENKSKIIFLFSLL